VSIEMLVRKIDKMFI